MEINLVSFQSNKAVNTNDSAAKNNNTKNSDFSKALSSASSQNNDEKDINISKENVQTSDNSNIKISSDNDYNKAKKILAAKGEESNKDEDVAKDDKTLNQLLQLLVVSRNDNQDLLNLLQKDNMNIEEVKDMLAKLLKENLADVSKASNSNSQMSLADTLKATLEDNKSVSKANANLGQANLLLSQNSIADALKPLDSKVSLNESINLLAQKLADKLASDKDLRTELLSQFNNFKGISINSNTIDVKKLIISQLKSIVSNNISDDKDLKPSIGENLVAKSQGYSVNNLKTDGAVSKGSNESAFKFNDNSKSKEDSLLKQLTEQDGNKNDNIADKIANIVNRFEAVRLDTPVAAGAKVEINRETFNTDFIKAIKFMDTNSIKELSVKVLPKDLGEIVIKLSMDNGIMKANITAANKDTYNLLNAQLPTISSELSKQNMTIQNFSLSLYNGDNFLFNGNGSRNENSKQQSKNNLKLDSIDEIDAQNESYLDGSNTLNLLA